jgi:hypothetical protein
MHNESRETFSNRRAGIWSCVTRKNKPRASLSRGIGTSETTFTVPCLLLLLAACVHAMFRSLPHQKNLRSALAALRGTELTTRDGLETQYLRVVWRVKRDALGVSDYCTSPSRRKQRMQNRHMATRVSTQPRLSVQRA